VPFREQNWRIVPDREPQASYTKPPGPGPWLQQAAEAGPVDFLWEMEVRGQENPGRCPEAVRRVIAARLGGERTAEGRTRARSRRVIYFLLRTDQDQLCLRQRPSGTLWAWAGPNQCDRAKEIVQCQDMG
jgi:hypothetical protein